MVWCLAISLQQNSATLYCDRFLHIDNAICESFPFIINYKPSLDQQADDSSL